MADLSPEVRIHVLHSKDSVYGVHVMDFGEVFTIEVEIYESANATSTQDRAAQYVVSASEAADAQSIQSASLIRSGTISESITVSESANAGILSGAEVTESAGATDTLGNVEIYVPVMEPVNAQATQNAEVIGVPAVVRVYASSLSDLYSQSENAAEVGYRINGGSWNIFPTFIFPNSFNPNLVATINCVVGDLIEFSIRSFAPDNVEFAGAVDNVPALPMIYCGQNVPFPVIVPHDISVIINANVLSGDLVFCNTPAP